MKNIWFCVITFSKKTADCMVKNKLIQHLHNRKQINYNDNLDRSSSICERMFYYNHGFSRIYTFTTENVSGYIDYFDFRKL